MSATLASAERIRCTIYAAGAAPRVGDEHAIAAALADPTCFVRVEIAEPAERACALLERTFGFHPLAVEDAVKAHQRAKLERYERFWLVLVHAARRTAEGPLRFGESAIFVGETYVVTIFHGESLSPDEVDRRLGQHGEATAPNAAAVLHATIDAIVDAYVPLADAVEDRLEELEGELLGIGAPRADALLAMFALRKETHRLWRAVHPVRDVVAPIARGELPFVPTAQHPYFRDVADHATRVTEQLEATRESIDGALDVQISVSANRQADVTRELTVIATIFLPLTFISGFFGQNFGYLVNHIAGAASFWWLGVGTEVAAIVALVVYFRIKGWF